jgi:protein-tyrosine phosphatase
MNKLPNFRDLGGIKTDDGKHVRNNLIFRSGNPDGVKSLPCSIKTKIDLRSPDEANNRKKNFPHSVTISLPINLDQAYSKKVRLILYRNNMTQRILESVSSIYSDLVSNQMETIKRVFDVLNNKETYPLLIHCRAGQDRTGFICAVILLALGVKKETIIKDYILSNSYTLPKVKYFASLLKIVSLGFLNTSNFISAFTAHEQFLQGVFNAISDSYGGVDHYLEACGISGTHCEGLRNLLLE